MYLKMCVLILCPTWLALLTKSDLFPLLRLQLLFSVTNIFSRALILLSFSSNCCSSKTFCRFKSSFSSTVCLIAWLVMSLTLSHCSSSETVSVAAFTDSLSMTLATDRSSSDCKLSKLSSWSSTLLQPSWNNKYLWKMRNFAMTWWTSFRIPRIHRPWTMLLPKGVLVKQTARFWYWWCLGQ